VTRRSRRPSCGQALVEFALVIPIFLVLLFAMIDIGRVIWANDALSNAVREGARYAIVHGGSETTVDPVGPGLSKQPVVDVVRRFAFATGNGLTVGVCYGTGCSGDADTAGGNGRGTPVTVTAHSTVPIFTGSLLGFTSFGVSASSTMVVNN
jgi:Flp pilus assembly protein TadG